LEAVFTSADPLLARQSAVPLTHLFVRALAREAPDELPTARTFLAWFERTRRAELRRSDGRADPVLAEFTHLMQHGTNEARSLERRLAILREAHARQRGVVLRSA
jgi:hypothetical protein